MQHIAILIEAEFQMICQAVIPNVVNGEGVQRMIESNIYTILHWFLHEEEWPALMLLSIYVVTNLQNLMIIEYNKSFPQAQHKKQHCTKMLELKKNMYV